MIFNVSGGGAVLPQGGVAGQVLTKTASGTKWGNNYKYARNLLGNSYFILGYLVNQRGKTSYAASVYGVDRWKANSADCLLSVEDGYIRMSKNPNSTSTASQMLEQLHEITPAISGKKVTLAAKIRGDSVRLNFNNESYGIYAEYSDWTIVLLTAVVSTSGNTFYVGIQGENGATWDCEWAALYEGEYTAETLPEYQPKEYTAELAECQWHYRQFTDNAFLGYAIIDTNGINFQGMIPCATMRIINPTIVGEIAAWNGEVAVGITSVTAGVMQGNGLRINGTIAQALTPGSVIAIHSVGTVALSADL